MKQSNLLVAALLASFLYAAPALAGENGAASQASKATTEKVKFKAGSELSDKVNIARPDPSVDEDEGSEKFEYRPLKADTPVDLDSLIISDECVGMAGLPNPCGGMSGPGGAPEEAQETQIRATSGRQ